MPRKHDRSHSERDSDAPKPKRQKLSDSQLERKRELDREAQRTIRERTKNHIAHLESLVEQLQGDRGSQVEKLVAQLNESRAEINRLRDALSNIVKISTAVASGHPVSSHVATHTAAVKHEIFTPPVETAAPEAEPEAISSKVEKPAKHAQSNGVHEEAPHNSQITNGSHTEPVMRTPNPVDLELYTPFETRLRNQNPEEGSTSQGNPGDQDIDQGDTNSQLVSQRAMSIQQIANSIIGEYNLQGRYWYLCGVLLSHILKTHRQSDPAIDVSNDEDIAIRAVFEGWSVVMERYPLDKGWQWLKELDEKVYFNYLGPAERLMNLRNCRFQFLHQLYPDAGWNSHLPAFYAARPSQQYLEHDPLIEYFPWPAFRERLLFSPRKYATNGFMEALRQNLQIVWNFDPADLYQKNFQTNTYTYSEKFLKHLLDIRCYTVRSQFFEKDNLWELRQDIPGNEPSPLSMISHRFSIASAHSSNSSSSGKNSIITTAYEQEQNQGEGHSDFNHSSYDPPGWRPGWEGQISPGFIKDLHQSG